VDGAAELLVQSRADAGIPGSVQVGPTIQTSRNVDHGSFADLLLGAPADRILCDTMQSEEGGRFFAETHRHLVVDVTEVDAEPPVGLRWLGLRQVHDLLMQGRVNSQLRSLLALLLLR
jgi:oxidase EvaA